MTNVVELSQHRKPVTYTIHVVHHWNGEIELLINDIAEDPRSDDAVMEALCVLVEAYRLRKRLERAEARTSSMVEE